MEALAVGASVAGILSLTGQCVSGAQTLRSLYQDIKTASETVDGFLKDISSLIHTLNDVEAFLDTINAAGLTRRSRIDRSSLGNLSIQLEDCKSDLDGWIKTSQSYGPAKGRGGRAVFRKWWIAVNQGSVRNITTAMQRRRVEITLSLSVIGRMFDAEIAMKADQIKDDTTRTVDLNQAAVQQATAAQEALNRIEALSESISEMSIGSMRSLASISSALSARAASPDWSNRHWDSSRRESLRFDKTAVLRDRYLDARQHSASIHDGVKLNPGDDGPSGIWEAQLICNRCRQARTKCDGGMPCANCVDLDLPYECTYGSTEDENARENGLTVYHAATTQRPNHGRKFSPEFRVGEEKDYDRSKRWCCSQLSAWRVLFIPCNTLEDGTATSSCVLCSTVFVEPEDAEVRWHHMDSTHMLGQCTGDRVFNRGDYFGEHLRHSHNAILQDSRQLEPFLLAGGMSLMQNRSLRLSPQGGTSSQGREQAGSGHSGSRQTDGKGFFPCYFAPYGCPQTLDSKNGWMSHIHTQHLDHPCWRCIYCQDPGANPFYTSNLLATHIKDVHPSLCVDTAVSKAVSSREARQRLQSRHCAQPQLCRCLFCSSAFHGESAWWECLEHIGKHLEAARKWGEQLPDPTEWHVDPVTERYFARHGMIVLAGEECWAVPFTVRLIEPDGAAVTSSRKRKHVADDSEPAIAQKAAKKDHGLSLGGETIAPTLMTSSWDAGLLTEWSSTHDRINRWILHALGSDADQADTHRQVLRKHVSETIASSITEDTKAWSRLVFKYWFLDEALVDLAEGIEVPALATIGSLQAASLLSPRSLAVTSPENSEIGMSGVEGVDVT